MLLLWCYSIALLVVKESKALNILKERDKCGLGNQTCTQLKNEKEKIDGGHPQKISNDEISFDSNGSEDRDYDVLDVEEDYYYSFPSDDRNYENLLNYIRMVQSAKQGLNNLPTSENSPSSESPNEIKRFKRENDAEFLSDNLDNSTYYENILKVDPVAVFNETGNMPFLPNADPSNYDIEHATPEMEPNEDRWTISPCVTNLRELYTCILCSDDPSIRTQFLSCYELLPERVKKQGIECYSKVLKLPFDEGSEDMDYYHHLCKKFKSIEEIVKCVASSLPELPMEKFLEEERVLAKYSYCLHAINLRHCC